MLKKTKISLSLFFIVFLFACTKEHNYPYKTIDVSKVETANVNSLSIDVDALPEKFKRRRRTSRKNMKKLDINKVTAKQLTAIRGIGIKKAQAIIDLRDELGGYFESFDEVLDVKGISEKKLEVLKQYLKIGK